MRVGAQYGVSAQTVKCDAIFARAIDRIVQDHGDPEVRRRLLGADVRLTSAGAIAMAQMPLAEREKVLKHLLDQGEMPRPVRAKPPAARPKEAAEALFARLQRRGEGHARAVARHLARLAGLEVAGKPDDE
jgi:hypothetical protein